MGIGLRSLMVSLAEAPAGLLEAILVHFRERGRLRIAEDVAALIRLSGM